VSCCQTAIFRWASHSVGAVRELPLAGIYGLSKWKLL
jgi:hypothetical protein